MTALLFFLLVVLWGAVLIPAIVRARQDASPMTTVLTFRRGMHALGSSGRPFSEEPRAALPFGHEQVLESGKLAIRVHRWLLACLCISVVVTFALGLIPGLHGLLTAHLALDLSLGGYVVFLVRTRQRRQEVLRRSRRVRIVDGSDPRLIDEERIYLKAGEL